MPVSKFHLCQNKSNLSTRLGRGRNRGRVQGIHTSPPPQVRKKVWPNTNKKVFAIPIFICSWPSSSKWPSNPYTSSGYKGPENQTCNASVNSQFHLRLALPPGWPPGISIFFALDGKFPGVGTLELSNPPGWGWKNRANALSCVNTVTFFIDRTVK